jgi:protein-ribulosamine 3-kinase
MNASLLQEVTALLQAEHGGAIKIRDNNSVGGGCISQAEKLTLEDGSCFFLKSHAHAPPQMFEAEAAGLKAMAAVTPPSAMTPLRIPKVLGTGTRQPFILMEFIEEGRPKPSFSADFGRQLAEFHRASQSERFGFKMNNYIGSTPQPNPWTDRWLDFWREHRLAHQFELARRQGLTDASFNQLADRLLQRVDDHLAAPEEKAVLMHGDLWGGNYLVDKTGHAVLIDPATYYGRREADLAMTHLFGGFDAAFYRGYEEVWPLAAGSDDRLEIYKLYHLLNHLNLFGSSYRGGCLSIMRRFA